MYKRFVKKHRPIKVFYRKAHVFPMKIQYTEGMLVYEIKEASLVIVILGRINVDKYTHI